MTEAPREFDEAGKELDIDAQVWKTYVRETYQIDKERVDSWNESMDVILLFAALFSAISTAFVIESYKILKQDPTDLSSQTLLTISHTLMLIANGSQPTSISSISESKTFQPSTKAVCVNVLWFLSLSLSVAVSLISMLAKEWSLEFISSRTGSPGMQARRRQQRWDGLVNWKMEELMMVLPSLIHLSLLLFAIGLCIFLWDVHYGVAIPVIIVTIFATSIYCACTLLPFLHEYCPYGTVISRFARQIITTRPKTTEDEVIQDKVTANALNWMLVTCEDPQPINITLQSLAGADEELPTEDLAKHHAWVVVSMRRHLKRLAIIIDNDDGTSHVAARLYARALESYLKMLCKPDLLTYGPNEVPSPHVKQVLLIQATIRSLINQLDTTNSVKNKQILDQCTEIGQYYLTLYPRYDASGISMTLGEPNSLAEDLVNLIEQDSKGDSFSSDMHCILSASLAFLLCCEGSIDFTRNSMNTRYTMRMIRHYTSACYKLPMDSPLTDTITRYLVLETLWVSITPIYTHGPWRELHQPEAYDYLWANLMSIAYSDIFTPDLENSTHSMWFLLTHPGLFNLSLDDCMAIEQGIILTDGPSTKIKSIYHACYIYDLSCQLATMADEIFPRVLFVVNCMRGHSPWEDSYLLPTVGIYIFTIKYLCTISPSNLYDRRNAYMLLEYSPIPKYSSQLVQQLSSSDLITHLSNAMGSQDRNTQLFATAQLGVFFHMALYEADRQSPTLSALETELLKYPGLGNDVERQEVVAEELETKLMAPADGCDDDLRVYAYRVLEAMLERRSTPLPRVAHNDLNGHDISKRLRGIESFVNYETERSLAYPDVVFDEGGQPFSAVPLNHWRNSAHISS